jgi:S1-C subfamily serine protease
VTGARDSGSGLGPVHSETDLAVIKVDGRNLPVLPFADSNQSIRLAC